MDEKRCRSPSLSDPSYSSFIFNISSLPKGCPSSHHQIYNIQNPNARKSEIILDEDSSGTARNGSDTNRRCNNKEEIEMHQIEYVVWKEGDMYVSHCLNVEVASCGDTREEAISNLKEAVTLYFEDGEGLEFLAVDAVETGKALVDA